MSYVARCIAQAASDTRKYWTSVQISTTFASPVAVPLLVAGIRAIKGLQEDWRPIGEAARWTVIVVGAGWVIAFSVNLFLAPGRLDESLRAELEALRGALEAKHPRDARRETEVRNWLVRIPADQRGVIDWLLDHGPATMTQIRNALGLLSQDAIINAVREGEVGAFIERQPDPRQTGTAAFSVHRNYQLAVRNVFDASEF